MRIKKIEIKGLFGMFNHTIPLNYKERITIIYGINGIGKTMLFRILDSFFNLNFFKLVRYPFESLIIEFDNQEYFKLNNSEKSFIIEYKHNLRRKVEEFDLSNLKSIKQPLSTRFIRDIERMYPVSSIADNKFIAPFTNEILTIDELFNKFPGIIQLPEYKQFVKIEHKKELEELIKKTNLYFIQTQRLITFNYFKRKSRFQVENEINTNTIETVKQYSDELYELIQKKYSEYAELSQEFELSLGKRLKSKDFNLNYEIDELIQESNILDKKRNELKSVGLFEDIKEDISNISNQMSEIERAVLSVNIQDMKKKLEIFDDLYKKLKIFLDILNNRRFTFKKISINPKKGFIFQNDNGEFLDSSELSSGEQHEIVLLYQLLFKIPENSLVLIDEPEISLHVAWQMEFLSDMEEIVKLRNIDLLVATHSPTIINGNWDLTVELGKQK